MSDSILERAMAAQQALQEALEAEPPFAGESPIPVTLGYPVDLRDECAWVSCTLGGEIAPVDSASQLFSSNPHVGGGIYVSQMTGEDWSALRARLQELFLALEELLRRDRTLGGTCANAYISSIAVTEIYPSATQVALRAIFELDVQQYVA